MVPSACFLLLASSAFSSRVPCCASRATAPCMGARLFFFTLLAVAPTLAPLVLQRLSRSACTASLAKPLPHWCV